MNKIQREYKIRVICYTIKKKLKHKLIKYELLLSYWKS